MEVVWFLIAGSRLERYCKVVAQSVHQNYDGLLKRFRVPTSILLQARSKATGGTEVNGWYGAFGAVLEDESREKESAEEEVDGEGVEDTATLLEGIEGIFSHFNSQ